ncbi:MAG TPA: PEP/pyruvate-binding domain-containing protein, partial [bacterium]|nr:PEP/pyruvate-binding domain-containing protein [bacterium]
EVSGVAFTADPVSHRGDVVVISAVLGLGEGLVGGELNADLQRVAAGSVETQLALKDRALRRQPDGGTAFEPVEPAQASAAALTEAEALDLAARFKSLERELGRPQDLEWALDRERRLRVLQARPITTLGGELRIWDNSNIVESYAGVTLPLTFSFARGVYEEAYIVFSRLLGVSQAVIDGHRELFSQRLAHIQGRVYYNLITWYGNLALLPFYSVNRGFMEGMMGVGEALPDGLVQAPREGRLAALWRMAATLGGLIRAWWTLDRDVADFHARVQKSLGPLEAEDLRDWDADRLARAFRGLERDVLAHWHAPLVNDLFAMVSFGLLRKAVARWRPDLPAGAVNDLLSGEGGIISTEPLRALDAMARQAAGDPDLLALFQSTPDDAALLAALPAHPAFLAAFNAYLRRFGARCAGELKLETVIPRDDPQALLALLRPRVQAHPGGPAPARDDQALRLAAEASVLGGLGWWRAFWFRRLLGQARRNIRHRENQRFERTRAFAVVRRIFQGLGRRLAEAGPLARPDDVFYLTKDEVFGALDGTASQAGLGALAALRRHEFAAYTAAAPPPDRFSTWGPLALAQVAPRPVAAARGELQGLGCCPGRVRAQVRVVDDPRQAQGLAGRILVAERTDPGWTLIFPGCAGILVERGSLLSHSAIVARELGLPCVVAVPGLLASLKDHDWVEMDGSTGQVRRVEAP